MELTVYCRKTTKIELDVDKPPSERYISIMTRGATNFVLKQEYIEFLKNLEVRPRTKLS